MDEQEIRKFFEKDGYAAACGITIDQVSEGCATCSFEVKPHHLNAGNVVQGGALFTLGDFAFAVAANAKGCKTVSLENQITFMHSAKGKKIVATATEISAAKNVCFYQVELSDDNGRTVARMSVTGYCLE